jgi:hypothetical protein
MFTDYVSRIDVSKNPNKNLSCRRIRTGIVELGQT